jgi:hypothetical protein
MTNITHEKMSQKTVFVVTKTTNNLCDEYNEVVYMSSRQSEIEIYLKKEIHTYENKYTVKRQKSWYKVIDPLKNEVIALFRVSKYIYE